ncbi:MAG: SPOR domain-containing protein [Gemmatimonadetes bacterium]|nr:SPOR domain-containing protein [Gemmatimonadota bacterium]
MMSKKILLFIVFLSGCVAQQNQLVPPADSPMADSSVADSSAVREEFDPQTLMDDDMVLQTPARAEAMPPAEGSQIEGFRVQVAALRDHNRAEALREQIQRDAQVLTYIYFDEDIQLYKIQAGNSHTPESAEILRDAIRALGFPDAYVVRTQIANVQPQATLGFRVQIFSSSTRVSAENAQMQARVQLARDDVFIEFEPPYFKVRVGNFQTRNDAEILLKEVTKKGYETAFIVQAKSSQ